MTQLYQKVCGIHDPPEVLLKSDPYSKRPFSWARSKLSQILFLSKSRKLSGSAVYGDCIPGVITVEGLLRNRLTEVGENNF